MKPLKNTCILVLITVLIISMLPVTALAGVVGGNIKINTVSSKLMHLTSTNPTEGWAWGETPTEPYKATLSPASSYTLPADIIVWRVHYYSAEELEAILMDDPDNLYNYTVKKIYAPGTDYDYDPSTGEIVIPLETLTDIAFSGSTDDIEIIASGSLDGHGYVSSAATVSSQLTNLTSSKYSAMYIWGSTPTADFTASLSPEAGYSLPPSVKVYKLQWYDPDAERQIFPPSVAEVYAANSDYTYNASTGEITIPIATLSGITADPSPYNILIVASGVATPSTYAITVTQSANGAISPASAFNISQGSDLTFTITPGSGFKIADVLVDGESVGVVNTYTFTNIRSNHTITGMFERIAETLSPSGPPPSTVDPPADLPVTGGGDLSWVWWLLCSIWAAGIAALILVRKKAF